MKVAVAQVQGSADREANRRQVEALVQQAAQQGADLVVLPEMSVLEFFPRKPHVHSFYALAEPIPGPTSEWFSKLARSRAVHIVYNHYERSPENLFFDTSVVIDRTGTPRGRQRMMHLGEEPGYNEKFYYTPGWDTYRVFELEGWRFGVAICYDRQFPEVFRSFVAQGAQLVLIPTAVAGGGPFGEVYELEMRAAAITHGVYIAMANRAGLEEPLTFLGRSMMIDPLGKVMTALDARGGQVAVAEISQDRVFEARTLLPFLRDRRPETYGEVTRIPGQP